MRAPRAKRRPKTGSIEPRGARGFYARVAVDGVRRGIGFFPTVEAADAALEQAVARLANGGSLRAADAVSFVYFIQDGEAGAIKIGRAKNPAARLYAMQTGSAGRRMRLLASVPGGPRLEVALHAAFAHARLDGSGEWFEPTKELLALTAELAAIMAAT